jgi:hypothetical protein
MVNMQFTLIGPSSSGTTYIQYYLGFMAGKLPKPTSPRQLVGVGPGINHIIIR